MQGILSRKLAIVLALSGALAVQSACSNEPTSETEDRPSLAAGPVLSLGGPDSIYITGNYTYGARLGANYAKFTWWTRSCSTLTVASCTTGWSIAPDFAKIDPYTTQLTRRLTYSCSPLGKSYQVKVTASGFNVGPQTAYKATKLCGSNPNA
jgi:hypothetical protein